MICKANRCHSQLRISRFALTPLTKYTREMVDPASTASLFWMTSTMSWPDVKSAGFGGFGHTVSFISQGAQPHHKYIVARREIVGIEISLLEHSVGQTKDVLVRVLP
jgi:hypothetical protein